MNSHKTDSLQKLPQEELQLLLVRYTLRAFPAVNPDTSAKSFDEVFFLRHARTLLAMCCFVTESSPEIRRAAQHAASSAREYEPFKLQTATSIAIKSAADALLLKDAKKKKQKAIKTIELIPFSDFHAQAQRDLDTIRKTSTSVIIFDRPLWTHPVEIMDPYQPLPFPDLEEVVLQLGFWQDWYKGFLDGKPLDWELQRRVALIDDAIWEAGPEAVAKEIECIRAKFELEQEIAALKEQLSAQQQISTRNPQIGDNGGPPLDGPAAKAFKKDLVLIWSDIEELESELSKPEPSPPVLKRIAQSFSEIALRIAAYCGTTLDTIVKEGAKTIGKGAGGLIVAEYVKPGTVEAVAKAIGKYLSTHAN